MMPYLQIKWGNRLLLLAGLSKNASDNVTGLFPMDSSCFWGKKTLIINYLTLLDPARRPIRSLFICFWLKSRYFIESLLFLWYVVRFIDLESNSCGVMETYGNFPVVHRFIDSLFIIF